MGYWGYKILENDVSADVADLFEGLLQKNTSVKEIEEKLNEIYFNVESDDRVLYILGLATAEMNFGNLTSQTKKIAIDLIESGADLNWWIVNRPKDVERRQRELEKIQNDLLNFKPKVKKTHVSEPFKCTWKQGDVFAHRLDSDFAKNKGLFGQYILVQKVDEVCWNGACVVPIVYLKITSNGLLPNDKDEYDKMEYIQTSFTKYEQRFWPLDFSNLQNDIKEKSRMNYVTDEFGYLPEFRAILAASSSKNILTSFDYVGNYAEISSPLNEFIPHSIHNVFTVFLKKKSDDFEKTIIERYCYYNRRECAAYQRK